MPSLSPLSEQIRASVFSVLAARRAERPHKVLPLHIGDTYLLPPVRLEAPADPADPALYLYRDPNGEPSLRRAFLADLAARRGLSLSLEETIPVAGATHGLLMALQAVIAPGDEVLLLAPYWPLFPGLVRAAGGVPVEVPFFPRVAAGHDPREVLAPYLSPRCRALYFASPNNPDGAVLAPEVLASLASLARAHDWWIFSDEVYAPFVYEGAPASASHPLAPERTITAYSMSKSHALAGLRLGMMTAPPPVIGVMRRLMTHTLFQVPLYAQRLAERAITEGTTFLEEARARYREARDLTCTLLGCPRPRAGAYVFLDLSPYAQGDIWRAIDAGLDAGVSLAPGEAFGPSFQGWARLCFTAVPPEELAWGLPRLRAALEGLRGDAASASGAPSSACINDG